MMKINNKKFFYDYSLNKKRNEHSFNKKNLKSKKNVLKKMLTDVLMEKVDFKKNIKVSTFANILINKIKNHLS